MNETIQFMDLKRQYVTIKEEISAALSAVCEKTAFSGGPFVEEFEKNFADYCHSSHCSAVNSGTSALQLALVAAGIKPGDEVIVPANTFIATAWAVSYVNATPVFVDCTSNTWNIDPQKIEGKITKKTKAIIGVHLYGQPFDVDAVKSIADTHGLSMIEDCAQAHGALYKDKKVGGFGLLGCFSFYPGKNLGAYGEGGAIVSNNGTNDQRIKSLRNHGSTIRYHHEELGFNMRMDGFQGAVLNVKLRYLDSWNKRRRTIAQMYRNGIKNDKIRMQSQPSWSSSVYHLFVATVDDRDHVMQYLQDRKIFCGLHYPIPCHLQRAYSHLGYKKGDLPNAEYLADHCVSLPMYPELTDAEVSYIIDTLNGIN
ncbi:MAG: DegT/DnrJ/EryC1/StrS family aminotransferase [Deltaproteobacteria bacterium]|nr:DegT/DnrJ/EryC1/StrS family aminotransferase [Deltaproteobacteria bacterium]